MKCLLQNALPEALQSLPVRGAWIEMSLASSGLSAEESRSPCGERGLKCERAAAPTEKQRVAPRAGSVD